MRKYDFYWQSNDDWYHFEKGIAVINEDAPPEAQESYKRYLEQLKERENNE